VRCREAEWEEGISDLAGEAAIAREEPELLDLTFFQLGGMTEEPEEGVVGGLWDGEAEGELVAHLRGAGCDALGDFVSELLDRLPAGEGCGGAEVHRHADDYGGAALRGRREGRQELGGIKLARGGESREIPEEVIDIEEDEDHDRLLCRITLSLCLARVSR
jgi:hypothetical protein